MSGLLDQAGLTAGSGLTNGAGLYRWGNFNPFDPTDLDPYLLFDTGAGSMIGTLENPTLDLDPSNQETLDVITATRSSVATRTLPDGRIALAEQDTVRVDYTQGAELTPTKFQRVGYTDFSNTTYPLGWLSSGTTLVEGAGYLGQPSRIFTAEAAHQYVACGVPTTAGVTYTGSIWVRRISGNETLRVHHSSSATGTNSSPLSVTTEWTKVEVQFLGNSSNGNVFFGIKIASPNAAGNSVEIAMPQVEEGTTASSFVANTTGSPKFITGATYGPRVPMILVEPSSENLVTYSEDFSDSSWNKADVTVSAAPVAAPDGTMTASHVVSTGSNAHLNALSIGGASTHTQSIWARTVSGAGTCFFNYHGGTPTTVTEQWQRFEVPSNTAHMYAVNFRGTSTLTEIYIWGAQLETGSVSTSYIPTSGGDAAARTRAADDLVISGSAFDFYNQSEGTFYFEGVPQNLTDDAIYWMDMAPSSERIAIYDTVGNTATIYVDGTSSSSSTLYPPNQLARLAISVKSNFQELSINGGTSVTLTESSLPSPTSLHIGSRYSSSNYLNGHIKRLIYWPTHSSRL